MRTRAARAGPAAVLVLRTVPAIKQVGVRLDGVTYRTGAKGLVAIPATAGSHHIRILPPRRLPKGISVRFARWLDGIALADREIILPRGTHRREVGFIVSRPVTMRFTDPHGTPVPRSDVARLTLTDGLRHRLTFSPSGPPHKLDVNRITRDRSSLVSRAIRYSVRDVMIDDSDVVYNGRQHFSFGRHRRTWTVRLLLFPLRITVRDALFGFGAADAVRLTLPDGSSRVVHLGPGHAATVPRLPRGTYELAPAGPGFGLSSPVALSNPQAAKVLLLSWVDVLVMITFVILFMIGLPLAGGRIARRPGTSRRLAWRTARSAQERPGGPAAAGRAPGNRPPDREDFENAWRVQRGAGTADVAHGTNAVPVVTDTAVPPRLPWKRRER